MMRRAVQCCAVLMAVALPAGANDTVGAGETATAVEPRKVETAIAVEPRDVEAAVPPGYAFDKPEVLAAQLLWGVAHGARLLGLACAKNGHYAATQAWLNWQEREAAQIDAARRLLGNYYFADAEPLPAVVSAAIGLKLVLDLPPEALEPACATLAEALAQPRYDMTRRHADILETIQRGLEQNFHGR
ncbi:MAG: hypothetical protein Q7U85_05210 [Rhodocyclaceae bacterium]|nr:hypothetical protein [Rhodocyclaceae bacterium]